MIRTPRRVLFVLLALVAAIPQAGRAQTADPTDALFDDTRVHEIRLAINSRDWQTLKEHFLDNDYYPATLTWGDQIVRNIGIRSRGTGSRSGVKPGLRIDFDYWVSNQKFLGLKSVILRNNTQDASNMREVLSMALFRRMGMVAEREAFTRLYVNNEYVGLYTIVESIDKPFLGKRLGEDGGYLYEYRFDNSAREPYTFTYVGANPASYVPQPFKPETHESDPRPEVIRDFMWAVDKAGDAAWRQAMAEFLDLTPFVRHLAIENFLADQDGLTGDYGPNNFYLYGFVGSHLFRFLPWDKSNTFWDTDYSIFRNINSGPENHRNRLVLRAFTHPELLNLYYETLLEAAEAAAESTPPAAGDETKGWLEREADRYYTMIRDAARTDPVKPFTNDDFEGSSTDVKNFARNRSGVVRQQVASARGRSPS
jgi:spore coat protein CotH